MKLLSLNTHSLIEPDYEAKREIFVDFIAREQPEVFALQEVNQTAAAPLLEMCIRDRLNALQGVGDNAAKSIVECRVNGEFISKEDLRLRSKVSKTVIETLDNHGCLEGMQESNQLSLFG